MKLKKGLFALLLAGLFVSPVIAGNIFSKDVLASEIPVLEEDLNDADEEVLVEEDEVQEQNNMNWDDISSDVVLEDAIVDAVMGEVSIPDDAFEFDGRYYYLYNGTVSTYEAAEEYCESLGGHLATITSQDENDALYAYIKSKGVDTAYFGLSDAETRGTYKWVTGEEVDYLNWHVNEPNHEGGRELYGEFYWKYQNGQWNDGDFAHGTVSDSRYFICEWESEQSLLGHWVGKYYNNLGIMALDLEITSVDENNNVEAIFNFSRHPENSDPDIKAGSYKCKGTYNPSTNKLLLSGSEWISKPSGWIFVPINGDVDLSKLKITGRTDRDGLFLQKKTTAAPSDSSFEENGYTVEYINSEINYNGYAIANVKVVDSKDQLVRNTTVYYVDESGAVKSTETNLLGYASLKSQTRTFDSNKKNAYRWVTKLYTDKEKKNPLKSKLVLNYKVTPLKFTQNWSGAVNIGAKATIGPAIGLKIGPAEAKASVADASIGGSVGGLLNIENEHDGGKRNITVTQEYNVNVAAEASVGPVAEAGKKKDPARASFALLNVNGGVGVGATRSMGVKLDDFYNPDNTTRNLERLGGFLFTTYAAGSGNALYQLAANVIDFQPDTVGTGVELNAAASADFLNANVKVGKNYEVEASGIEAGASAAVSYSSEDDYSSGSVVNTKTVDMAVDGDISLGKVKAGGEEVVGAERAIKSIGGATGGSIYAVTENEQLTNIGMTSTISQTKSRIVGSVADSTEFKLDFGPESINQIKELSNVKDYANGDTVIIRGEQIYNKLKDTQIDVDYSETNSSESIVDIPLNIGLKVGAGLEAGIEIKGTTGVSYESVGGKIHFDGGEGVTIPGNRNDILAAVNQNKFDLKREINNAFAKIKPIVEDIIEVANGIYEKGVEMYDLAVEAADTIKTGWNIFTATVKSKFRSFEGPTMAISTYPEDMVEEILESDDKSSYMNVAYTVGLPYSVWVTDERNREVKDFSEAPLRIRLRYSESMLKNAGLSLADANKLAIYKYSSDLLGYVYMGGLVDTDKKEVVLEITEPGDFILAVDGDVPSITNVNVDTSTNPPSISFRISDKSDISDLTVLLDGKEILNASDYLKYYNVQNRTVTYTGKKLRAGEHVLSIQAGDANGNYMDAPIEYRFTMPIPEGIDIGEVAAEDIPLDGKIPEGIWIAGIDEEDGYTYTGKKIKPEVRVYNNNKALKPKKDYTVAYKNNVNAATSTSKKAPTIVIKRKGKGIKPENITFTINPVDISKGVKVTFNDVKLTGKPTKPSVSLLFGKKKLSAKKDFSVSVEGDTAVLGRVSATVVGKGNYTGTVQGSYLIFEPKEDFSKVYVEPIPSQEFTGKLIKPALVVKLKSTDKEKLSPSDYLAIYENNKYAGKATIYIVGRGAKYSKYGGVKKVTFDIKKTDLSKATVSLAGPAEYTYTGQGIKPAVSISFNGVTIAPTEYTLSYSNNVNINGSKTPTVKVTGKNTFTGSCELKFNIVQKTVTKDEINIEMKDIKKGAGSLSSKDIKPVVKVGERTLKKDTDYKINFTANTSGTAQTAEIELKGNYAGKFSFTFNSLK